MELYVCKECELYFCGSRVRRDCQSEHSTCDSRPFWSNPARFMSWSVCPLMPHSERLINNLAHIKLNRVVQGSNAYFVFASTDSVPGKKKIVNHLKLLQYQFAMLVKQDETNLSPRPSQLCFEAWPWKGQTACRPDINQGRTNSKARLGLCCFSTLLFRWV